MIEKKELLVFLDRGITGTLLRMDTIGSEDGYANVYFYPLNKNVLSKSKQQVIKNIPLDCIHTVHSPYQDPGVEKKIIYIYTDEQGSIVKNIFNNTLQNKINEYKEQITSLKKQVAASRQEASDARSGVNKTLESMKQVSKANRTSFNDIVPPRRPYGFGSDIPDLEGD